MAARCRLFLPNPLSCNQQRLRRPIELPSPFATSRQYRVCSRPHQCPALGRLCFRPQDGAAASQQRRTLFADNYFGLDQLTLSNNKQKLRVASPEAFKARLRADFEARGVRNVFISDLELFLAVSENAADLELFRQLVEALLQALDLIKMNIDTRFFYTRYRQILTEKFKLNSNYCPF